MTECGSSPQLQIPPVKPREGFDRVLWVNHFAVTPDQGGGTRHFELSRRLIEIGWKVTVAASDFNFQSRRYNRRRSSELRVAIPERVQGVMFDWLWSAEYSSNNWRRAWNWLTFSYSVLTRYKSEPGFDVVIGSSPHLFAALAGFVLAKRLHVPYVLELRDLWPESLVAVRGKKGPGYLLLGLLARSLYRWSDRIVVLASGSAEYLARSGIDAGKMCVIQNGVDTSAFIERAVPYPREGEFTIVYTGAHGPANGLDVVLDAAELLLDVKFLKILLVGDGPSKPALIEAAAARRLGNVEFVASVPKSAVPAILAAADAGLMVLRDAELFSFAVSPNKLLDYLASELPVVCNVPGEVATMLAESGAGIQATDSSPQSLADAVRRLMAQAPDIRRAMGRAGREWVKRERSPAILGERLSELLIGLDPA